MSIVDSRADRRLFSARVDAMKGSIASLRAHIDLVFRFPPLPSVAVLQQLAEIDVHLARAAEELDAAQQRTLKL